MKRFAAILLVLCLTLRCAAALADSVTVTGKVVSTEEIFETVWGAQYLDSNNTVMVHIRRIREKLHEPPKKPRFIKTVWGVGYRIETK